MMIRVDLLEYADVHARPFHPERSGRICIWPWEARPMKAQQTTHMAKFSLVMLVLALIAGILLGGCQRTIRAPEDVTDPVSVFVVDYGRHASLVLPDEEAGLVEWSWGDWNWFALERTGVLDGLRAVFASPLSTLSRRGLNPAPDTQELATRLGAAEVLSLDVERERAGALLERLEQRWLLRADEAVTQASGRVFVPDDARYSMFNNSVHEIVRWLEALNADVSGSGVTADFKLREPSPASRGREVD
jgi:hypothetical protein